MAEAAGGGRFSKLESNKPPGRPDGPLEPAQPTPGSVRETRNTAAQEQIAADDNYPSFLLRADEAFFTGRYRDALRHYSRALQLENNQVYPWIGQVSCLIALKQYKEAELWSNRGLEQFPEDSSLLSQRARVLAATGNLKRALGVSDYALAKGATSWTWLARGQVLLEIGDQTALFAFEKAIELAGREDWRIPLLAGLDFARKRQWASAEDFLRRAASANPSNYFIWYEYARALLDLNFTDRARDAIARTRQLKPDFLPARELEERLYKQPFLKRLLGNLMR